jgi:2-oxoisovalerate dehydrogenase E2 component (dihydrolipoyl transacylase)
MTVLAVKLRDIGEGVAEAEIVEWMVKVGDEVHEDQILLAVMTDKATVEIPSPASGTVVECRGEIGSIAAVGAKLVAIDVGGGARGDRKAAAEPAPAPLPSPPPKATAPAPAPVSRPSEKPAASPSVRRRARELSVDLRDVVGRLPGGRVGHDDLDAFVAKPTSAPAAGRRQRSGTVDIKVVGLRRKIAEKMAESSRRIAHFSYVEEIDMTALDDLRVYLNQKHAGSRQKLTVLPFIARAIVAAVVDFPQMNALYDDERGIITRHNAVHIGVATQTPSGLMVPVLRNAEGYGPWGSAAEIKRLAEAARDGSAKRDDLSGSTISITSLGDLGGIATTPIINRPEVAIIGVNRIATRPMWLEERVVPRKMMNLSSSFDHRVIDGQDAAMFIRRIKELLERPAVMFIES